MRSITPVKTIEEATGGRDMAAGGYSLRALERLVYDCSLQPEWRARADLSVAYYDGKQLTEAQQMQCRADGLEPRSTNLIGRVINGVLGQEAKSRSDVKIESDTDEISDVVDALNPALKEATRETYADMAVSMAYSSQVKAGAGWVEVSRASDGLAYPYRVMDIHRNEMWWDWRSKDFLLRDARWLVRMQWHDLDELQERMPKHRRVLEQMANSWEAFDLGGLFEQYDHETSSAMSRAHDDFRRFRVRSHEWFDSVRKRVKVYEVWYKVPASAVVLKVSPTRKVLYDENNPLHVMAVSRGLVKVERTFTMQVRKAIFAGPYRLTDEGTTKRNFPYVPFFAFRDDEDGTPYGLIEGMKAPQDEYNERRLRIQWLLKARQVHVDNDALDLTKNNWKDLAENVMRPDMLLILNAARRNSQGVKVESNLQLQQEQVEVMQDAKQLIQDVPGVYSTQLGNAPQGVTSGVAISGLVEQGMVSLGEMNDNYRHSRRLVFENLLDLLVEDHDTANLKILVGEASNKRWVVLNTFDENGLPRNMVKDAPVRVGLSEVPASPAARAQEAQTLGQVISGLANNPQAVMALTPAYLELSSLNSETRRQAVEDIRRMAGLPPGGDRASRQKQEEAAAQQAADKAEMERTVAQVAIDGERAKVAKDMTAAELNNAKAEQIKHEIANPEPEKVEPPDPDAQRMRSIDEAIAEAA